MKKSDFEQHTIDRFINHVKYLYGCVIAVEVIDTISDMKFGDDFSPKTIVEDAIGKHPEEKRNFLLQD